MKAISFTFGIAALLVGCAPAGRDDGGDTDGDSDSSTDDADGTDDATDDSIPVQKCNKMDIIFIVDDSASMEQEQGNLSTNFPMFASILSGYVTADGDPLDYRIAVTTTGKNFTTTLNGSFPMTEHGPDGTFVNTCSLNKRWIEPTDPNMESTLTCRANVGIGGSGYEMPLLMTKHAVEKAVNGDNVGFLRQDALLAIVVLTDEDDVSSSANSMNIEFSGTTPPMDPSPPIDFQPSDLVAYLDAAKGGRSHWAAGIIAGDPPAGQSKCSGNFGDAAAAPRLKQFVELANANGTPQAVFSSICQGDLSQGLMTALATFQNACETIVF